MHGMASTRSAITRASEPRYDIEGLIAAIDGVPTVTDSVAVRRRSRDFFWYSPILNAQLGDAGLLFGGHDPGRQDVAGLAQTPVGH